MRRVNGLEYGAESWHLEAPDDAIVFEHPAPEQVHPPLSNPAEKLQEALQQPLGMPPLDQLVDRGSRVSITMNDWMGGSLYAAPAVLGILCRAGVKEENIPMIALSHVANAMRGYLPPHPLLRKGGIVIMTTPGDGNFDERYRPSDREVVRHYARVNRHVDDLFDQYAEEFLTREDLLYKYRHCYGFHPIHPFWILSSTQYVLDQASKVIYAGAKESEMSRLLGITVTQDLPTAWQMAVAETGPQPRVTVLPNSSKRLYVIFEIAKP